MVRRLLLLLLLIAPFLLELAPLVVKNRFLPLFSDNSTGLAVFIDANSVFLKGAVSFMVTIVIILLGLFYLMKLENK